MPQLYPCFARAYWTLAALGASYSICVGLLLHPYVQSNALYMHKLQLTWRSNLAIPEQFGFAKNQVTPLYLPTPDGEQIFAWHILPLGLYMESRDELVQQSSSGVVRNPAQSRGIQLLMEDPEARLIIHFHGNAGTVGAATRPAYLRSLSAAHPSKIHILAIDYRGFGLSTGTPTEDGLITDGLTAVNFAVKELGIPPSRIALVGQSLGTAVTFGVAERLATKEKTELAAVISIAGFSDMTTIVRTYRIGGVFPVLSPLRIYPVVQQWLCRYVYETWDSVSRVAKLVQNSPNINLIFVHSKDDFEIPYSHVEALFLVAANATSETGVSVAEVEQAREVIKYGDESTLSIWPASRSGGRRITQWVVNWGGHNKVVTSAGTSVLVAKAFGL